MSDDKKQENNFKFGLYLRGEKIFEKIFSADLYNPVVRYSVDIRDRIPSMIEGMQKILQKDSENLTFSQYQGKSTINYYKHICKINRMHPIKLFVPANNPKDRDNQQKLKFPAKGTEFKFGLYINQNPIVERNFYVDNYNPEARFSNELYELLNSIVGSDEHYGSEWNLKSYLKKSDVNHMWNDYDLIRIYGMNGIQQVRDLSKERRKEFLDRMNDVIFVERIRSEYFSKNYEYSSSESTKHGKE